MFGTLKRFLRDFFLGDTKPQVQASEQNASVVPGVYDIPTDRDALVKRTRELQRLCLLTAHQMVELGLCFNNLGQWELAIKRFRFVRNIHGVDLISRLDSHYFEGEIYEHLGRNNRNALYVTCAFDAYSVVYDNDISFRDVVTKVDELRTFAMELGGFAWEEKK